MKKLTIRKAETLKTTAAFYAGSCGSPRPPIDDCGFRAVVCP